MVELGNGDRFFFDFGPGCVKNILAMGVPVQEINDIFITHLHVDHYHDLSYLLPFSAWGGRWKQPLRVTGPSGRTPELGTQGMVNGMKQMLKWHLEAFDACPIGDGYEVEVNEFDWKDENGVCYEKNGVTIRHWRRSHAKDGASAYRLDWNGLSFVWTGDGRPDELTAKYAQGADVFVTESQPDLARLNLYKYGLPEFLYNYTVDIHHTLTYAAGYLMKQVNPRCGMITHIAFDNDTLNETSADVRAHWDGLFLYGAPDVVVVNVTKDAIWHREAALPGFAGQSFPNPTVLFGDPLPLATGKGVVPQPTTAARGTARAADPRPRDRPAEVLPARRLPRADHEARRPARGRSDRDGQGDGHRRHQARQIARAVRSPRHGTHRRQRHSRSDHDPDRFSRGGQDDAAQSHPDRRPRPASGVLVNDFGSINIDAELVVGVEGNMMSLANGCVCCQIRDDLIESVIALLERPETIEYILLEASGVADPAGLFVTFNDPNLRDRIRLDSVICVIDADQVFAHPEYPPLIELKLHQVGFADMLILNKVSACRPRPGRKRSGRGSTNTSTAYGSSRPTTAMCPTRSCSASGASTPLAVARPPRRQLGCPDPSCHDRTTTATTTRRCLQHVELRDGPAAGARGVAGHDAQAARDRLPRKRRDPQHRCASATGGAPGGRPAGGHLAGSTNGVDRAPRTQIVAIGAAGSIDAAARVGR